MTTALAVVLAVVFGVAGLALLLIGAGAAHLVHRDGASRVAAPLVLVAVVAAYGVATAGAG